MVAVVEPALVLALQGCPSNTLCGRLINTLLENIYCVLV